MSFNPLPHAEGDLSTSGLHVTSKVSIHSLTQRETKHTNKPCGSRRVSIHSLTQRETPPVKVSRLES